MELGFCILIEIMASIVRTLHQLVIHLVTSEERLQPYKMSETQISDIFTWLDQRRRGSVDVSDFFARFPDLNESELFYVFKFLDYSRKGAFTLEDLSAVLGLKQSCDRDPQDDSIRSFTNLIRVLKATFNLLSQQRKKQNLTTATLEQLFLKASQKKKQKIDLTDLVVMFREASLEVSEKMLIYLKNKVFNKVTLSSREFVQVFGQFVSNQEQQQSMPDSKMKAWTEDKPEPVQAPNFQNKLQQRLKNSQKINTDIDRILQKYRNPSPDLASIPQRRSQVDSGNNFDLSSYLKPETRALRFQHDKQNSQINMNLRTKQLSQNDRYERDYRNDQPKYQRQIPRYDREELRFPRDQSKYENIPSPEEAENSSYRYDVYQNSQNTGDYSHSRQVYTEVSPTNQGSMDINRRREELKKGSLERQRIMDDLMNKKKIQYSGQVRPGAMYTQNLKGAQRQRYEESQIEYRHGNRSGTPTANLRPNYDSSFINKLYQSPTIDKQVPFRPASATKASNFYDKAYYNKFDQNCKPDLVQFYRRAETPKKGNHEKQNILKKAEEEATKKIQEIQRRAKLKVMEKRSVAGVYNRWLK